MLRRFALRVSWRVVLTEINKRIVVFERRRMVERRSAKQSSEKRHVCVDESVDSTVMKRSEPSMRQRSVLMCLRAVARCVAVESCSLVCRGLRVRRIAQSPGFESTRDRVFILLRDRGVTCGTRSIANLSHRHKVTRESPRASRSRRVASCVRGCYF